MPTRSISLPKLALAALLATLLSTPGHAERADRSQPVNLEADRITVDEGKRVHVFEGNVRLSQGSLHIEAVRIVVTQDADGFQRGVATGTPARFRQKKEGSDEYVSGEAERVEYDARTERVEFFGKAVVKSGLDEVRGAYIGYDAQAERYLATATSPLGDATNGARVRATIQPRVQNEPVGGDNGGTTQLQPDDDLSDKGKK